MNEQNKGASAAHFHVLNAESRKYIKRALILSNSAFSFSAYRDGHNWNDVKNCTNISDDKKLVEHLKTADRTKLTKCHPFNGKISGSIWQPRIEKPETKGAFLDRTPEQYFQSKRVPPIDIMFGMTSAVF